jgi:hypothetical protein
MVRQNPVEHPVSLFSETDLNQDPQDLPHAQPQENSLAESEAK